MKILKCKHFQNQMFRKACKYTYILNLCRFYGENVRTDPVLQKQTHFVYKLCIALNNLLSL